MSGSEVKHPNAQAIVHGGKELDRHRAWTPNETAWIEFIRLASHDSDPAPTLARVQALRRIFSG